MTSFNDRRVPGRPRAGTSTAPMPKTKPELNGHLVNDHEYLEEGAGSSARNLPSKADLEAQHASLHAGGQMHAGHVHSGPDVPPALMPTEDIWKEMDTLSRNVPLKYDSGRPDRPTRRHMDLGKEFGRRGN